MSKLFRARALDASKPLPIYMSEELPDLPEYSAINRAVPQMPSGMNKEEECEHHLQRAIVTGLIIPTPEVEMIPDKEAYDRSYPANYKQPRQLIHMQPFSMEEDIPDYDMDSEDEKWLSQQKLDITPYKFEEMMDQLEKNCAQNIATQSRKELLLKDDDELSIAIYDYWLAKRINTQPQPLVPTVKTEANNRGSSGNMDNNPYLAFRRRTEKMQTRKNRKNDETSYEKMVKLKRDLTRALQLLEMVKRRESAKKDLVELTVKIYEKRYQANDLSGSLLAEVSSFKTQRPAFAPIYTNQFTPNHASWPVKPPKDEVGTSRKEKRQYKKRKHKTGGYPLSDRHPGVPGPAGAGTLSSGEDEPSALGGATSPPSSPKVAFPFHRRPDCSYHAPVCQGGIGSFGWSSTEEGGAGEERYRFSLTAVSNPQPKLVGLVRRRIGRGGRIILDRASSSSDDLWSSLDFTILDNSQAPVPSGSSAPQPSPSPPLRYFRPKTPPPSPVKSEPVDEDSIFDGSSSLSLQVQNMADYESTALDLDLGELFPELELDALRNEMVGNKRPGKSRTSQPLDFGEGEAGCSYFSVTDDRWRPANDEADLTTNDLCSALFDSSSSLNHRLPPPPSGTASADRVPPVVANGPINHSDHGGWGQLQSTGNQLVSKWNANGGDVNALPGSAQMSSPFNTKLAARSTSSQLNDGVIGGDNVHTKRQGGASSQTPIVHSAPPMEVT
uniref:Enhancer of polycomb-like protein n=1 Tax=Lygus hesperus TaxID=30085 RepID=A0A0A9Y5L3_LYGHE